MDVIAEILEIKERLDLLEEKANKKRAGFIKPTLEQIKLYCIERKNNVDAEAFYDFYESKGWMIGKNKMKNWKNAVHTWEQRDKAESKPQGKGKYDGSDAKPGESWDAYQQRKMRENYGH